MDVTTKPWQRFSDRQQGLAPTDVLHKGVPPHLEEPLRWWVYHSLERGPVQRIALRLEMAIPSQEEARQHLSQNSRPYELLDIIDAILAAGGPWPPLQAVTSPSNNPRAALLTYLSTALDDARSAYRINDRGDGLTTRVPEMSSTAFQSARDAVTRAQNVGSAQDLLKTAWSCAYDLHPDPPKAYRAAIAAIEAAAAAVIEPNNTRATLGTMIRQLQNAPQKYRLGIPGPTGTGDVAPLIAMLQLIWQGQTSRHGAQTATRHETLEEARVAVQLAVTVVHWFATSAVQRVP